ncbi:hypothetical protein DFO67_1046 [Modicisalibacter xianhensis]|uniref:Uncharacterized protein n=1 Tax=Modicisalibacter xianhensis TaxID=442341 RepID=A0A4V3GUG1_9GAMM|nr:hypothetical protein [Halomonas xianhensis]TDX30751.1 hypothetical protein DFO67_1046 [Halomonas xianhensis]
MTIKDALNGDGTIDLHLYSAILADAFHEDGYQIGWSSLHDLTFTASLVSGMHADAFMTHGEEGRRVPLVVLAAEKDEWLSSLAISLDMELGHNLNPDNWMPPKAVNSLLVVKELLRTCDEAVLAAWKPR